MFDHSTATPPQRHLVDLITDQLSIQGSIAVPFRRLTDALNSEDRDFLTVEEARITPLVLPHQVSGPLTMPVLVRRVQVRYAATFHDPQQSNRGQVEFAGVRKVPTACYGFLGPFVFHGHLHMRPGTPLLDMMEIGNEQFLPLTEATVYLIERPDVPPRQHEVIIINRTFLDALYLA